MLRCILENKNVSFFYWKLRFSAGGLANRLKTERPFLKFVPVWSVRLFKIESEIFWKKNISDIMNYWCMHGGTIMLTGKTHWFSRTCLTRSEMGEKSYCNMMTLRAAHNHRGHTAVILWDNATSVHFHWNEKRFWSRVSGQRKYNELNV